MAQRRRCGACGVGSSRSKSRPGTRAVTKASSSTAPAPSPEPTSRATTTSRSPPPSAHSATWHASWTQPPSPAQSTKRASATSREPSPDRPGQTGPTRSVFEDAFLAFVHRRPPHAGGQPASSRGYEVDMLWRPQRLIAELDGRAYHQDTFEEDRERDAYADRGRPASRPRDLATPDPPGGARGRAFQGTARLTKKVTRRSRSRAPCQRRTVDRMGGGPHTSWPRSLRLTPRRNGKLWMPPRSRKRAREVHPASSAKLACRICPRRPDDVGLAWSASDRKENPDGG